MRDLTIVHKRTPLERHKRDEHDTEFIKFLEAHPSLYKSYVDADEKHHRESELFFKILDRLGLSYKTLNLDELANSNQDFYHFNAKNLLTSNLNLVISLGGDGTLLQTSHYIGGTTALLGVNSAPEFSIGHLCKLNVLQVEKWFEKKEQPKKINRLKVQNLSKNENYPLVLNDALFCNKHPGATSRYQLSLKNPLQKKLETHISSGVWISTAVGQTAGISAYKFKKHASTSRKLFVAVREPYQASCKIPLEMIKFSFDAFAAKLTILSEMRHAVLCLDGHEYGKYLTFGDEIEISSDEESMLRLHL